MTNQPAVLLNLLLDQFERLMAQAEFGQSTKLPANSDSEQTTGAGR